MTRKKYLILILIIIGAIIFLIPNIANAAVGVTKNVYSNNGSTKFNFTGLTLNTTHEYEFGLTKTAATQVNLAFNNRIYIYYCNNRYNYNH